MNLATLLEDARPDTFGSALSQYQIPLGGYNEAVDAAGAVRPAWVSLLKELGALPRREINRRLAQTQRQLDLDGVAFNPHDSNGGVSRPWSLDAVPLVIAQSSWQAVESGLDQRARLADLILLDLLGPQTLLRERVLPPEVLYEHPHYQPAWHSLVPRPHKHLQLYAADLARGPDGAWLVTADRTRSPFGLGYVLENRLATSRMLPEAFSSCHTIRLASFFITLRQTLRELANRFKDNPRIAIWSKGPQSRAYFEDSFLSRYLGYTLVEGEDLAVRDNRVMLKTLGGLLPVEVLLRRIDDHDCDPSELTGSDNHGVPGLLEVVRSGGVAVCNSIGSVLAESPLLQAYLPQVCRHLLGEELRLPSLTTWWCGHEREREYVFEHLDEVLIRTAHRSSEQAPYLPREMAASDRAELCDRIRSQPTMYVAQQYVTRSTTPVLQDGQLESWSLALRAFLVADGDSYQTLPGALARVSTDPDVLSHNMTSGEKSQDVWIVAEQPVAEISLLAGESTKIELRRGGAELPSRVADNLFWLGRNLERSEQIARLVRATLKDLTGEEASRAGATGLLAACLRSKQIARLDEKLSDAGLARELSIGTLDASNPQSLKSCVLMAHHTASKVRDRISMDSFRTITELHELFALDLPDSRIAPTNLLAMLDQAITDLNATSGFASESMTRTQGWRFFDLGRRLERAYQTAQVIKSLVPARQRVPDLLEALEDGLRICDSFMTYRNRYLANIQPGAVLDLLVADETNPRSIAFQLQSICDHVENLPRPEVQAAISAEQRLAMGLFTAVRLADVAELDAAGTATQWPALQALLKRIIDELPKISDAISARFLIHVGVQRHFAVAPEVR